MPVWILMRRPAPRSLEHLAARKDDAFGLDEFAAVSRQTPDRIPLHSKMLVDVELAPEVLHAVEASRRQEDFVLGVRAVDLELLAGSDEERPENVVEGKRRAPESGMPLQIQVPQVCRGTSRVSLQMHHHIQLASITRHREVVQADVPNLVEFQILPEHSIAHRNRLEGKDLQEGVLLRKVDGKESDVSPDIDHSVAGLEINRPEVVLVTLQSGGNDIRCSGLRVVANLQRGLVDFVLLDGRNEPVDQDERDISPLVLERDLIDHDTESA